MSSCFFMNKIWFIFLCIFVNNLLTYSVKTDATNITNEQFKSYDFKNTNKISALNFKITDRVKHFTSWSPWSYCLQNTCTIKRYSYCDYPKKCEHRVLIQEKPCEENLRCLKSNNTMSEGYTRTWVVGNSKVELPIKSVVIFKNSNRRNKMLQKSSGSPKSFILFKNNMKWKRKRRRKQRRRYGSTEWGPWSACSSDCLTYRHRACRKTDTCTRYQTMVTQTAYCYTEGTDCHWQVQNQIIRDHEWKRNILEEELMQNCGRASQKTSSQNALPYQKYTLKIMGGQASVKNKWPWQVALLNIMHEPFCGGSLIASSWVLTAAHCVRRRLYALINAHDLWKDQRTGHAKLIKIAQTLTHPGFDRITVDNDVALLKLAVEVDQPYACLPKQNQNLPYRKMCTILGWGKRNPKDRFGTSQLHETKVPIVPQHRCRNVYDELEITDNMFCAGLRSGGRDTCAGDSGGPLLCSSLIRGADTNYRKWTVHGVTSFGLGCGRRSKYGIYTAVDNYIDWIYDIMSTDGQIW